MRRAIAFLVLVAINPAAVAAADGQDLVGRVVRQEGVVVVLRSQQPQAVVVGADLYVGDEVRTGPDGKLLLDCPPGLQVVIGPATVLQLRRFAAERDGGFLDAFFQLVTGITRLVGETLPGARTVSVVTETAVASVRSTDWLLEATEEGTGVFVREGRVSVTSRAGGTVLLEAGEGTDVRPGEPPTPPRTWGAARRDAALARTSF